MRWSHKRRSAPDLSLIHISTGRTGNSETAAPAGDGGGGEDTASTGEVVKLKALIISHALTKDITDMKWVSEIEEKAGVEIEWEQIRADWETVKSTRFAAGLSLIHIYLSWHVSTPSRFSVRY